MTENEKPPKDGLNGFAVILAGSILLPLFLVGLIMLIGQDWSASDDARTYDILLLAAVFVIFGSDWIRDRPVWQRFPRWVQENGSDVLVFIAMAAFIAWHDADPDLTGTAWWRAFAAHFILMLFIFAAVSVLWATISHWRKLRKQRKSGE